MSNWSALINWMLRVSTAAENINLKQWSTAEAAAHGTQDRYVAAVPASSGEHLFNVMKHLINQFSSSFNYRHLVGCSRVRRLISQQ